ncbi:MAG: FAD-dependent oxidoreductase [Coriobacteriaceae bacterium]|nr:FAD-dependent oxidoreductase [Coriobacteriaceae bacterium]
MNETDNMVRVSEPYGGASVDERKAAMRRGMSDEEIAARNVIPTRNSGGEPLRIIADEVFSENDTFTHYKPASPDDPGPASAEPPKPGVLREAAKITDRLLHKTTYDDPDYWGLASVMTEEEAELARHMKVRVPMTLGQVCAASGLTTWKAQELLDDMSIKGIVEYNWENLDGKNPRHQKRYVLPMFVPGSAEFTVMNQKQLEEHPELGTFFERMTYLPLTVATKMVPPGGAGIGMHVIPVEHAIRQESHAADVERLSHWLKKYDRFSAGACSCRLAERARGDNGGDDPQNWCLGVGDMADYCVETGKGHYVTYDEFIDILLLAEKNGFVHQITNIDGEDKIFAICNCNVDVCYALRTSQLFNTPNMSRSAYVAHIEEDKCVACAGCVEVCPAGAVQLGQKLPTVNGPVEYPRQPLPTLDWSEADWDPDYKNNNRIECHDTGTAPCKTACPAHVSVQGYLRMAAQGRYRDALALIKRENPFPAVCGRVCNRRCEAACTRGTVDEAVAIDEVKRFVAEKDLQAETRYVPEIIPATTRGLFPQKIAIVGAGPAGLTCAYYLAEHGYRPTVFERAEKPGGMMTYGIPAYKLGKDVVDAEIDVLRQMGVEIRCGVDVGRDVTLDELRAQGYAAFYLAIGCQGSRKAGVAGEDAAGVATAVEFLRTALADPGHEVVGKTAVIGGGNVAIDAARVALRCGSAEVAMVCLEQRDEMPALPEEIAEAEADGVMVKNGWGPAAIETDDAGRVRGVTFKRCTRVYGADGRFAPEYDEADTRFVACDNVILAIGQSIEWGDLLAGSKVQLGRAGAPAADARTYQTDEPDVFVGGDVLTGPKFVIDAIAAGHEAAVSLHRFVQTGSSLTIGRNQRHYVELDKEAVAIGLDYDHAGRNVPACAKVANIVHNWEDTSRTFTEEQVKSETARCLGCGASIVDPNKCIGCGLCTTRCEFDAIHLHRDNPECSTMVPSEGKVAAILPQAGKMLLKKVKPQR